jgi:flavin reductase (DIM6/NTAB) family NADH-FMN oxidoreductase RutF
LNKRFFDLTEVENRDRYKLLTGLIVPRPIGWIGTRRPNGTFNLAPFSFFNVISIDPPTVVFSGGRHVDRQKDSVTLASESSEFTVNIVSEATASAMAITSGSYGPDDDEFAIAGLTAVIGSVVDAPMVSESPANLECRTTEVLEIGGGRSVLIVGEVVAIHVKDNVLDGTRIVASELAAIGRMAGTSYVTTRDVFEISRPG